MTIKSTTSTCNLRSFGSFFQATHYAKRHGMKAWANEYSFGGEATREAASTYQIKISHNSHGERIVYFKKPQESPDIKQFHRQMHQKLRPERVARRLNNKAPQIGSR